MKSPQYMNLHTRLCLRTVLEYLSEDHEEREHWEASGRPASHIYIDVLALEKWLALAYPNHH